MYILIYLITLYKIYFYSYKEKLFLFLEGKIGYKISELKFK